MLKLKLKTNILKALNRFASTDETRIIICGVHVEARRGGTLLLVATDGRRIAILELAEPVPDDFNFTIPIDFVNALPLDTEAELVYGPDTGEIQMQFANHSVHAVAIEGRKGVAGQYPNWRQVVPKPWPTTLGNRNIAVNMPLLAETCEAAMILAPEDVSGVVITSGGDDRDPICVRRRNFTAIVMPIRVDAHGTRPPSFAL